GPCSAVRRPVEAGGAGGENLAAILSDADRMFELGGERAVAGDRRPAVVADLRRRLADVDHRFDREAPAGLQLGTSAGAAGVDHFWRIVEDAAEAVAAEIADDGIAMALGMALDRGADVAERVAGLGLLDAEHQALIGDIDQPL